MALSSKAAEFLKKTNGTADPPPEEERPLPSLFMDFAEVQSLVMPKQLIEDYLPENSLVALIGESGAGKTFLALDMACCIATGHQWHGRDVEPGTVLYFIAEGRMAFYSRAMAWQQNHQQIPASRLQTSTQIPNLLSVDETKLFIADAKKLWEPPSLVVIDTLARHFGSGDENTSKDMNLFIQNCDRIREAFECCVLVVHHLGKDSSRGARGANNFRCALDAEFVLKKKEDVLTVTCTKSKDLQPPAPINLNFKTVLVKDCFHHSGKPVNSKILVGF